MWENHFPRRCIFWWIWQYQLWKRSSAQIQVIRHQWPQMVGNDPLKIDRNHDSISSDLKRVSGTPSRIETDSAAERVVIVFIASLLPHKAICQKKSNSLLLITNLNSKDTVWSGTKKTASTPVNEWATCCFLKRGPSSFISESSET